MIDKSDAILIQYAINHLSRLLETLDKESELYDPVRIALRGYDELSQEFDDLFPDLFSA